MERFLSLIGGDKLLDEKLTTSTLTLELEKLGSRMLNDLENFLVEYDGNLKAIFPGTLIKIPLGAGYVSCWISQIGSATIRLWLTETIEEKLTTM